MKVSDVIQAMNEIAPLSYSEDFDNTGLLVGDANAGVLRLWQSLDDAIGDERDAEHLFRALADEVVPLYYDRDEQGLPREWIRRMKHSMQTITWNFSAARIVGDYTDQIYQLRNGDSS